MTKVHSPPTIEDYLEAVEARAHPLRKTGGRISAMSLQRAPGLPLVTIFTVVRNCKDTLPETVGSVSKQTYPNIEYIVIDGASTDGTLEVIKELNEKIDLWISEPDFGPSDATNKAISHAKGDFVFWLSADDWADPDHVKHAVETLCASKAEFVFGNTKYYKGNTLDFTQLGDPAYANSITYEMPRFNTPSMVIKKACFKNIGLFDLRYKVASDYEWLLRLHVRGGRGVYDPRLNICHRLGGISSKDFVRGIREVRLASVQHGFSASKASRAFLLQYTRRRLRCLAEVCLPSYAYRFLLRCVRRNYSSHV